MAAKEAPLLDLSRVSERITATMGLHFPRERWGDLQRGLTEAAKDFGRADVEECVAWLATASLSKEQMQILADHLTIGETYFFREPRTFEALTTSVLPELIRTGRERGRRLRVWSAACCTGEEPYSLAILLSQVIPDLKDWQVSILATDINARFLQKAAAGIYSEWSFRDSPPGFKERHFRRTPEGRYAILSEYKKFVKFAQMNLVEDVFPALATDTNAMDLVFCRNVLMYFSTPQVRKVVENLRRALVDGGWLAVSPSEVSHTLYTGFRTESFPGVILYRKGVATDRESPGASPALWDVIPKSHSLRFASTDSWLPAASPQPWPGEAASVPAAAPAGTVASPLEIASQLYAGGRYAEAAETLLAASPPPGDAAQYSLLARARANQGELGDALAWCDRWLVAEKLDASGHYLRAVVLQELGDREAAGQALKRAVYLQPEMVLPHFALGNLARSRGGVAEAERHFSNALRLLRALPAEAPLPESDGLAAGRLIEVITSLLALEAIPS